MTNLLSKSVFAVHFVAMVNAVYKLYITNKEKSFSSESGHAMWFAKLI